MTKNLPRVTISVMRTEDPGGGKPKKRDTFRFSTESDGTEITSANILMALVVAGKVALGDLEGLDAEVILQQALERD